MKIITDKELIEKVKEIVAGNDFAEKDMIFEVCHIIPDGGKILYIFSDKKIDIESLNKVFGDLLIGKFYYYPNEKLKEKINKIKFNKETFSFRQIEACGRFNKPYFAELFFIYSPDIKKELNHAIWILNKECEKRANEVEFRRRPFKY